MSILQSIAATTIKTLDVNGTALHLRKIAIGDGIAASRMTSAENGPPSDVVEFYTFIISKCLCDEGGNLVADSDECREQIRNLPFDEFNQIGMSAAEWSGITKKN